jgi:crotonobetainyl-CoA:carnitine CoA-transferase CaiB-like acyl-CoA transferase
MTAQSSAGSIAANFACPAALRNQPLESARMRPLDGITVVALEQVIAGPFATRQLAELGARVIKIERPGGDAARAYDRTVKGLSSHFVWTNRSKESLALDVKHPRAGEIVERLLRRTDVFLQNLAPGAVERLGLGASDLRKKHPRLVWCGISGYGPAGPYAEKKAYDLLVQCEAGLLSVTGTPADPAKAGIPVADIAAGMYAYSSILAALLRRERTGEGATLDITMFEALGEWMGFPAYFTAYGGSPPPRSGAHHATIVPYGPFRAGDGGTVFLSVQNEREFARFCETVLLDPGLASDPRFSSSPARQQNRAAMHQAIEAVFSTLDSGEVVRRLEQADIANARLNSMQEFWEHPQLAARGRWRKVGSPAGQIDALKPPANIEGMEPRMGPVPAVGEHSRAILEELGYSAAEVARLADEKAI